MIKTILYDLDGPIIQREMYFSKRYPQDFGVSEEVILPFFKNEFQECLVGKADLKIEIQKYFSQWKWKGSVDELLVYWFEFESTMDEKILEHIQELRAQGVNCYLQTNNEKYRTEYALKNLGLQEKFDGIFSCGLLGVKKPDQEFWEVIWERLGKPNKDEVLMWDDDEENVESAKKFGFRAEFFKGFKDYQSKMASILQS